MPSSLEEGAERLRRSLSGSPQPRVKPPLIMVSGLPAAGKYFFCPKLVDKLRLLILASNSLRIILFPTRRYDEHENKRLLSACHFLIEGLPGRGIPVIFGATNLLEHHREYLYRAADRAAAKLILVWVEAPPEVVKQRLLAREVAAVPQPDSEAGWEIHNRLRSRRDKISCNHLVVGASQDTTAAVDKIVRTASR
jgi:predicted kinase